MFRTLRMKKIRVLVLDSYLDGVMKLLGGIGSVHVKKVEEKNAGPAERKRILDGYSDLTSRIKRLSEILNITEAKMERITLPEKSSEDYLTEIDETIGRIEKKALSIPETLEALQEEKTALDHQRNALEMLDKLAVKTAWLGDSTFLYTIPGFLNSKGIEGLKSKMDLLTHGDYVLSVQPDASEDRGLAVVTALKSQKHEVDNILRSLRFESLGFAGGDLAAVKNRINEITAEDKKLRADLEQIRKEHFEDLLIAREVTSIKKSEEELVVNFGKTRRVYLIEGWAPAKDVERVSKEIDKTAEGNTIITLHEPTEEDDVPVEFNNPKFLKPFEVVMEMFGRPAYTEIDPTPLMAITFPLFFGLMFGDVGHGALVALCGLGFIYMKKGDESAWKFGMLLIYCGVAALICGLLYGSFFGNEEILPGLYKDMGLPAMLAPYGIGHEIPMEHAGGSEEAAPAEGGNHTAAAAEEHAAPLEGSEATAPAEEGEHAIPAEGGENAAPTEGGEHEEEVETRWIPWLSPAAPNDMFTMIGVAMLFGAVHMGFGLLLSAVNTAAEHGASTLIPSVSKIAFLFGELALIGNLLPFPIPVFTELNAFANPLVLVVGLALPAAVILLSELVHEVRHGGLGKLPEAFINGGLEIFELFSMFLSNTISYSRLVILAVVHAMLMLATYTIASIDIVAGIPGLSLLVMVLGNILVLALETLVVFIHTIRLHFYEWFTKFYVSGGIKYAPFLVSRKYTRLPD